MHSNLFPSIILSILIIFISSINIRTTLCVDDVRYTNCSQPFNCGGIQNVTYPFWGVNRPDYCGQPGFELECHDDVPMITMMQDEFRVIEINSSSGTLKVARDDYWKTICPQYFSNTTLNFTLFNYASGLRNLTIFYNCSLSGLISGLSSPLDCTINGTNINAYYTTGNTTVESLLGICSSNVIVPVFESAAQAVEDGTTNINDALDDGFELQWSLSNDQCNTCIVSGGQCGYNTTTSQFICFCHDQPSYIAICSSIAPPGSKNIEFGLGFVILLCSAGSGAVITVLICALRRNPILAKVIILWKKKTTNDQIEVFIKSYGALTPKRYSYSDVKKMTKSFTDKLGRGGHGDVYKGKLADGRLVAVKILGELKGNGEEFINEVASISGTSHVNVVTLVGFCYEGTKRALIYEFMSNGSLDNFIYDQESSHICRSLQWETLYQIAVGIARGLEYLHRGCNTRIVHFDIKPHNILLDEDFSPKISDFGLAKLCRKEGSIVSMLGTRGTVGYIAPEVFCRHFGGVSHKSDVYSYGMMVLEMVGVRKNINVGVSNTSEIYFPHWIYKQLEPGEDLRLHGDVTEQEEETVRKMIIVSLWCVQINPSDRPSMTKVVEMLEGSLQPLQIPPMPIMSSPRKYSLYSSTTSSSSL